MRSVSPVEPRSGKCTFPVFCPNDSSCHECAEIQEVNTQIFSLEERKSFALSRINARRDLLATRLPLEVVCDIFEEYVKLHPLDYNTPFSRPLSAGILDDIPAHFPTYYPSAPLNLGVVCRQWRNIAWSHPPLWNTLEIDLSLSGHEHGPSIVREWLERSRSLPLDIRVVDSQGLSDDVEEYAISTVNVIKQFSSSWRSLDIRMRHSTMMYYLEESYFSDHQSAGGTSLLRHLSLVGNDYELPFEKILYPSHWTQLSHLHISKVHVDSLRWILERLSETSAPLTHLSVHQISLGTEEGHPEWITPSMSVVRLPILLSLSITRPFEEDVLPQLLTHLHTPALESLECHFISPLTVSSLISFISQSECSPEEFIISDCVNLSAESILSLLRAFSALTDLTLVVDAPTAALFGEALSQGNFKDAPILPRLRRLVMELFGHVRWHSVVGMYIEDPSTICHPNDQTYTPQIPTPGRKLLQLLVIQQLCPGEKNPIDIPSLVAFAYIRQQHGVSFQMQQRDAETDWYGSDLLVPSYCQSSYYDSAQSEDAILNSLR
ncbi:hypothetical protein D9619_008112 [Psilocybe cf. subviscida]|uniref:F-box domain-containing protein n=1 Tax=Psilocybe cf. subviscida TaxID=2480587 RepID=A0A8H5ATK8_9AGAR|nr:hypothetical protein D9619_008112 [Psilocybe cf. subviscida]